SYVRITIPAWRSSSPRPDSCSVSVAIWFACAGLGHNVRFVIYLDSGVVAHVANHLVTAGDDLIALLHAVENLDVGGAGDSGIHLAKLRAVALDHEDALNLLLRRLLVRGIARGLNGGGRRLLFQIAFGPNGERLNRNRQDVLARRGGDLRRARKTWPDVLGRIVQRDHNLEILGLLAGRGALRSGNTGGAHDRRITNFDHPTLERLIRNRVDGYVSGLPELHIDDVRLVHLHLGGDDRHIGDGHDRAAQRVLDTRHHRLAHAYREVRHHAVNGRHHRVLVQHVFRAHQIRPHLSDAPLRRGHLLCRLVSLRARLADSRLCFLQRRYRRIVLGLLLVVILFRHQLVGPELVVTIHVQLGSLQLGLCLFHFRLRGVHRVVHGFGVGFGGCGVGQRGVDGGSLRVHSGARLRALDARDDLALVHPVAFFHQDRLDGPDDSARAEVDVIARLDL